MTKTRPMLELPTGDALRVCMIVSNDMLNDPRVSRHAEALGVRGFKVTVVCPLSERTNRMEERTGYEIRRVRSELFDYVKTMVKRRNPSQTSPPKAQTASQPPPRLIARKKTLAWLKKVILTLVSILLLQLAMVREARRTRSHVYCANDLDTLPIALIAAGFDAKVVYDSHELWPDMLLGIPEFYRKILRSLEKISIKRTHAVMTVNELIADVLKSRYSIKCPVLVVYNTPATSGMNQPQRTNRDSKIVLYQGLFMPERGLENLVKSSQYLLPDVRIVLRGYGGLESELRRLASRRRNVRFDRPVAMQELVKAAQSAHVGVVSYLPTNLCNYLASPNKLFEYIQAGLPIAASDMPFMRKIILENDIGVLFDPRDPESIARALNKATRTVELSRYRRNLTQVAEKYNWENESRKLLSLYSSFKHA